MKKQQGMRLRMGRMYVSFLLVLLACALALHGAYLLQSYHSMVEQARTEREYRLSQQVYHTERYVAEIEDCANTLNVSSRLQQVLIDRQKPDYLLYADCRDLLSEYERAPYGLYRIDLYLSGSRSLITSSEGVFYNLEDDECAVYDQLLEESGKHDGWWTLDYQHREPKLVSKTRNQRYIALVRQVTSLYTGRTKGVLILSVPYEQFESVSAVAVQDEYRCISFQGEVLCGSRMEDERWTRLTAETGAGFGLDYYYRFEYSSIFSGRFMLVMGAIMLLFLMGFVCIVIITERRVAKPIARLLHGFVRMEEGRFIKRMGNHKDAIFGELNRGFDHMAEHLESTVTALVDERTQSRELKQRLLQMQIKPHFLYNIFNNMIWLVEQKQYDNLEQLVTATAGFYKTALNAGSRDIMLFENQRQLEYYVRIQKFRFGDRFDLLTELAEETEMLSIPNLLLQPLVENAIIHGFQNLQRRGEIRLSTEVGDGQLIIRVRDNGTGIAPETLEEIREAMTKDNGGAKRFFALVNVSGRLRNRYGSRGYIRIESVPGEGTEVIIGVPLDEC